MTLKTVAEIVATQDAEEAFLFMTKNHDGALVVPPSYAEFDALAALVAPWVKDLGEEDFWVNALIKLSTDDGRRTLLQHSLENGFGDLIETFADDRVAAHRPLMLDFFIEHCDDPGYFDEMLDRNADNLSDSQKLRLIEDKRKLN